MYPWNEPKEQLPLAVRQIGSFLRAHTCLECVHSTGRERLLLGLPRCSRITRPVGNALGVDGAIPLPVARDIELGRPKGL